MAFMVYRWRQKAEIYRWRQRKGRSRIRVLQIGCQFWTEKNSKHMERRWPAEYSINSFGTGRTKFKLFILFILRKTPRTVAFAMWLCLRLFDLFMTNVFFMTIILPELMALNCNNCYVLTCKTMKLVNQLPSVLVSFVQIWKITFMLSLRKRFLRKNKFSKLEKYFFCPKTA